MTTVLWSLLFVALGLLVLTGVLFIAPYNAFIRQRNVIQESWRQVDVELNRRYELIPNLLETVRAASAQERDALAAVTRLREQALQLAQSDASGPADPQRSLVEQQLTGAVRTLLHGAEADPELARSNSFVELQRQLVETEDRIAAGRRFYNANVRAYNTKVESFPSNAVANLFRFEKATYFEVKDPAVRQAPEVNLAELGVEPTATQLETGRATDARAGQLQTGPASVEELPTQDEQVQRTDGQA